MDTLLSPISILHGKRTRTKLAGMEALLGLWSVAGHVLALRKRL